MPWTWFIPLYVQMTLLTPFVIYLLYKTHLICIPIHLAIFALGTIIIQGIQIGINQTGISPIYDIKYFDQVFIKPWYFYNLHIGIGVIFGIFFKRHIDINQRLDQGGRYENSLGYTILTYFKKKYVVRLVLNLIGSGLWIGINHFVNYSYNTSANPWSLTSQILYGLTRGPISVMGACLLLLPMLLSKFRLLRRILRMRGFMVISHLSMGIYLWYPVILLSYLFQRHQMITISYLNILYFFTGSFFLAFVVSYVIYMLV